MNGSTRKHSTDTGNIPVRDGKSFRMRSYEIRGRNFLRICTYKSLDLNCPGINSYKKMGGGYPPPCLPASLPLTLTNEVNE